MILPKYIEVHEGFFSVEGLVDNKYVAYPIGGGLRHDIPLEAVARTLESVPTDVRIGRVMCDGFEEVYTCLYDSNDRWNGWARPQFTSEVFEQMLKDQGFTVVSRTENEVEFKMFASDDADVACKNELGLWMVEGWCWEEA